MCTDLHRFVNGRAISHMNASCHIITSHQYITHECITSHHHITHECIISHHHIAHECIKSHHHMTSICYHITSSYYTWMHHIHHWLMLLWFLCNKSSSSFAGSSICSTLECIISHMNASYHTWMHHITHECITSHMNASSRPSKLHVDMYMTYEYMGILFDVYCWI